MDSSAVSGQSAHKLGTHTPKRSYNSLFYQWERGQNIVSVMPVPILFQPFIYSLFNIISLLPLQFIMMDRLIAEKYRVLRYLFKVGGYIYCQLCAIKDSHKIINAVLYVYGNEEPRQILQMLIEKLDFKPAVSIPNLIFPLSHVEDTFRDQKISLFFLKDLAMPLSTISKELSDQQIMEVLHGALVCVNNLHSRGLVHGRISSSRSYIVKSRHSSDCAFSFNCLDFSCFMSEEESKEVSQVLFQSQGVHLGFRASFKDDMESLIYLVTHLLSRGRMLTVRRYETEWKGEADLLKWKHCDFFKQMVQLLPQKFRFLIEFYCYISNLGRHEKPDVKYMQNIMNVIHHALKKQPIKSQKSIVTPNKLELEESEQINSFCQA